MAKKMTMADIANLSGVGKSTVSRYFNGGYVKDETRAKIQKVIEEYNYTPNAFARLNAKQSNVIGVVVPTLNSKITSRVITSIDRYLREKGYTTLIQNSDHEELLKKAGIPVVVLTQDYEDGISIIYDDYHAGKTIGEYIGKKGHQKVGYIGVYETDQAVGIERRNGVLDGLKEYGITPVTGKSDYSFIGGQTVTRELLERESDLDAIICATDRLAFGAYKILHEYKKRIPEEVSVAAFGGYDESTLLTPELTTLKFDSYGMGYLGAETILKMITGEPVSKKQIVGYEFIEGGSVRS